MQFSLAFLFSKGNIVPLRHKLAYSVQVYEVFLCYISQRAAAFMLGTLT